MWSSDRALALALWLAVLLGRACTAQAQARAQGFALERLSPSAPGAGWLVLDDLDLEGNLAGAVALTLGYAHDPLRISQGPTALAVVTDQAFVDVAGAVSFGRWRFSLAVQSPIVLHGQSGSVGGHQFSGPSLDWGSNPDAVTDARLGLDVRLLGRPGEGFRLGAGGQLFAPFGNRSDYVTDGTFRGSLRLLVAGDLGRWRYAGQLGLHLRPLDDSPTPGSAAGNELQWGAAIGPSVAVGRLELTVGPEVFGETALRAAFGSTTTGLEALLSGRLELPAREPHLRIKLGVGGGLAAAFGAPDWRAVAAVELLSVR